MLETAHSLTPAISGEHGHKLLVFFFLNFTGMSVQNETNNT